MATARGKAELSDIAADHAREDYEIAKLTAKQFAPDFIQPGLEKTRLREILKQRMSIDQKTILQPLMPMTNPVGPTSSYDAVDASTLSLSSNNLLYSTTSGQQDAAETTPQFRPRSHYAQPYYQSTGSNHHLQQQQQQQQQQAGGVNLQSSQLYPRNSLTPEMRQNSSSNHQPAHVHPQQNYGYNQNTGGSSAPPPPPPSRSNNNGFGDQYLGNAQNSMNGAGARRPYGQNGSGGGAAGGSGGGPPTARQSVVDRASFSQQRMSSSSHAPYPRANEDGNGGGGGAGPPRRDSGSRPNRYNQYEVGVDDDTDPSLLRRNTKYVNRESQYSFQQAMSDHFDHYKRPPSRDNSVDRYSRAASRLSGGSRQSSVEKSQNQQQQRRGVDDRLPSSSSSTADKSFSGGAGSNAASAAGAKQNTSSLASAQRQPPPFEDIILRQRNLGQEIVPSPIGQPKRTESLYVNPNTARKETKPKVSTNYIWHRSRNNSLDNGDDQSSHGGSTNSSGSDINYCGRARSIIGCCCFTCNKIKYDSSSVDSHGRRSIRDNSGCRIDIGSTGDDNGRVNGDGRAIIDFGGGPINMDSDNEIASSGDGRVSRISGYIHSSRGRGVGRSRSNSTDNYGSRARGDGHDSVHIIDERTNMISSIGRPSRCIRSRESNRGRAEGRSSSRSADGRTITSTIPLNSGNVYSSGNSANGNNNIIHPRRSRSGLRVRFSSEVRSSDDPPGRSGGPNGESNHIRSNRHSSCDSYFDSNDCNFQVTTSTSVGRDNIEIPHAQLFGNTINLQVNTHENCSNVSGYGRDSIRRNFDDFSDNASVHRVGGYESGGVCCRNEDYVSNGTRNDNVVHGRSSNGGGNITNDIRGINGVYVRNREVLDQGDRHVRGVVIREISSNNRDSGQGTDDYEYNYDYEGFYNYVGNYDVERGEVAVGNGRVRRLLPSVPLVQHMVWFQSYLENNHRNFLFNQN